MHIRTCVQKVCDINMYEVQTWISFYYSSNRYTGWWHHGSTMMHGIPDPGGSLVNDMLSQVIEQANQEDRYSPHVKPQIV